MKHTPSDLLSFFSSPYEFLVKKYIKDSGDESIQLDPEDMFLNLLAAKGDDHELSILDDFVETLQAGDDDDVCAIRFLFLLFFVFVSDPVYEWSIICLVHQHHTIGYCIR